MDQERRLVDLASTVDAAAQARTALREHLAGLPDDVVETACLLADELVANVLLHVGLPSRLTVVRTADEVRVEVWDRSAQVPERRRTHPGRLTGRGLHLLDELADRWGTTVEHDGKTVWFTLRLAP